MIHAGILQQLDDLDAEADTLPLPDARVVLARARANDERALIALASAGVLDRLLGLSDDDLVEAYQPPRLTPTTLIAWVRSHRELRRSEQQTLQDAVWRHQHGASR